MINTITILFFHEILQIDKIEDADFKYATSFLKILAQKYSNKALFGPKLRHL